MFGQIGLELKESLICKGTCEPSALSSVEWRIADATLAYTLEGSGPVNLIFDARLDLRLAPIVM